MNSDSVYVLKVLIVSGGLALAIRYAAPLLSISPSVGIVLTLVLLPSTVLAIALGWRAKQEP